MSKKQVKTKKNVFGLVSKIGSLIKKGGNSANNIDNVETARSSGTSGSETPRKNFNIQISDDNQEIFAVGDDEEEEEEDEEENEKEIKDTKEKNENKENKEIQNKDNKIDKEIKNEILNPDTKKESRENENKNEIKDNSKNEDISIKEKEEEEKPNIKKNNLNETSNINAIRDDIKDETKISADNINSNDKEVKANINNNINSKIIEENNKKDKDNNINEIKEDINKSNNNIKEENIINDNNKINNEDNAENSIKESELNDNFETCHLCLKRGNDFNSDEIFCLPILRNKKKKSVLQKFGLFKKPKYDLVNYKIFFDECFIYLSKDIIIDKKNTSKRRINNVLKIKNIININTKKEQNKYFVTIDIYNKNGVLKNKEFFLDEKYFEYFNKEINKSLEMYGGLYMKSKKL